MNIYSILISQVGSGCHVRVHVTLETTRLNFFLSENKTFFTFQFALLQSPNAKFCGIQGDEAFEDVFCF